MRRCRRCFSEAPSDIAQALVLYIEDGSIWTDLAVSGEELLYGYVAWQSRSGCCSG